MKRKGWYVGRDIDYFFHSYVGITGVNSGRLLHYIITHNSNKIWHAFKTDHCYRTNAIHGTCPGDLIKKSKQLGRVGNIGLLPCFIIEKGVQILPSKRTCMFHVYKHSKCIEYSFL